MLTKTATVATLLAASSIISALAADLPAKKAAADAYVRTIGNWTGVYFGLTAGYDFSAKTQSTDIDGMDPTSYNRINGGIVGGQIGADYQFGSIVLGVAGDYGKSWASRTFVMPDASTMKMSAPYVATVRGRVGYDFNNQLLAYVTGGWAGSSLSVTGTSGGVGSADKASLRGYVLGAGFEYKYTSNISSFAEYRYYNYSNANFPENMLIGDRKNSEVRAGVNYRF